MATKSEKTEGISLEEVSKQIAEMLAEAKAEAAKIVAEAKASVSGEKTEEQKKAEAERKAYWDELVPVELFRDNDKYKNDVLVSVNDEHVLIKRGEKVMVKRKFAEVLNLSDKQDLYTGKYIEQKSKERPVIAEM